jgi:hypothetical protein
MILQIVTIGRSLRKSFYWDLENYQMSKLQNEPVTYQAIDFCGIGTKLFWVNSYGIEIMEKSV